MNALSAAAAYYLAAGRREEEMDEDGRCQDVYVRTPELVLMARRVDSSAPFGRIIDVRCRFEPERCDAWHLHFLAGEVRELLTYEREILSLPWILTQHGKRGDGRLMSCLLPGSAACWRRLRLPDRSPDPVEETEASMRKTAWMLLLHAGDRPDESVLGIQRCRPLPGSRHFW